MFRYNPDYMDKEHSNIYKGFFCILVLLSHIASSLINYFGILEMNIFTPMGYLAVSGFLFLSGFGLSFSTRYKGSKYYDKFLEKRILPIYIQYLVFAVVYCVFYYVFFASKISIKDIVYTLLIGRTYVANGWYIQCIVALYLTYYLCYRIGILKYTKIAPILIITPYILICLIFKFDYIYIQSILAFCGGYYFREVQDKINFVIIKKDGFLKVVAINIFLFVISGVCFAWFQNEYLRLLSKMCICFFFPVMFVILASRFNIRGRFIIWLGRNSLEIYLVQGFFLIIFGKIIKTNNMVIYIVSVAFFTFMSAWFIRSIFNKIYEGVLNSK